MHLLKSILLPALYLWHVAISTSPDRHEIWYETRMPEEQPSGSVLGDLVRETSMDTRFPYARFNVSTGNLYSSLFHLDQETGVFTTVSVIDREEVCPNVQTECKFELEVDVHARDSDTDVHVSIKVTVGILDINDNRPQFPNSEILLRVEENVQETSPITVMTAVDNDVGINAEISYKHSTETPSSIQELFRIEESTGAIFLNQPLDYEMMSQYILAVNATDNGVPPLSSVGLVTISVDDVNDNAPVININMISHSSTVPEYANIGYLIGVVAVHDADSGVNGQCSCSIVETSPFALEPLEGMYKIILAAHLDRENSSMHEATLTCYDHGSPTLTTSETITVSVGDVNDNAPVININMISHSSTVPENANIGYLIGVVAVHDADTGVNGQCSCSIVETSPFALEPLEGMYKIILAAHLDRENFSMHEATLTCYDHGSPTLTTSETITISVGDVNDNAPIFTRQEYWIIINGTTEIGDTVLRVEAFDIDLRENGEVTYWIDPEGQSFFRIDSQSGDIIAKSAIIERTTEPPASFIVTATDRGYVTLSAQAQVNIQIADQN